MANNYCNVWPHKVNLFKLTRFVDCLFGPNYTTLMSDFHVGHVYEWLFVRHKLVCDAVMFALLYIIRKSLLVMFKNNEKIIWISVRSYTCLLRQYYSRGVFFFTWHLKNNTETMPVIGNYDRRLLIKLYWQNV